MMYSWFPGGKNNNLYNPYIYIFNEHFLSISRNQNHPMNLPGSLGSTWMALLAELHGESHLRWKIVQLELEKRNPTIKCNIYCMYNMCVCIYIMYIYICMYVCMYVWTYVLMYVCMYVCTYERTYWCTYVCMYVCMYACTYERTY